MKLLHRILYPVMLVSFVLTTVTGVMMFFHFHLGHYRQLHDWPGIVFIVTGLFHLLLSLKPLKFHLKHQTAILVLSASVVLAAVFAWSLYQAESSSPSGNGPGFNGGSKGMGTPAGRTHP
jgi:hypothetical protein